MSKYSNKKNKSEKRIGTYYKRNKITKQTIHTIGEIKW